MIDGKQQDKKTVILKVVDDKSGKEKKSTNLHKRTEGYITNLQSESLVLGMVF